MGAFFVSWAMWEKLTFCLAGLLVIAFIAGIGKNMWTAHQRQRRYEELIAEMVSGTTATSTMIERRKARDEEENENEDKTIPFGIRALEKGIEVEGVWISRTNTPAPSETGGSVHSLTPPRNRSRSSSLDITSVSRPRILVFDGQYAYSLMQGSSRRSRDSSPARSSVFDQVSGADRMETPSTATSYGPRPAQRVSSTGSVLSYNRLSDNSLPRSSTRDTLEILDLDTMGTTTRHFYDNTRPPFSNAHLSNELRHSAGSNRSSVASDTIQKIGEDAVTEKRPVDQPRDDADDAVRQMNLLQSHRLSHVAETGQLARRARARANSSLDWTTYAQSSHPKPLRPRSEEVVLVKDQFAFQSPAKLAPLVIAPQRRRSGNTVREREQRNMGKGKENIYKRPETFMDERECEQPGILRRTPLQDLSTANIHTARIQRKEGSTDLRRDQHSFSKTPDSAHVLRKVNSGFEILHPGTLAPSSSAVVDTPSFSSRRNSTQRNKLQKKRRSSADSTRRWSSMSK